MRQFLMNRYRYRWLLIFSLLALAIGGGFGAWVYRAPVALQLTPPGLAEYVKFLSEVRFGQLLIERLYFLLPLAVAAYSIPLIAVNEQLGLHWSLNWLLRLSVAPLALSLLSPIWAPDRLLNEEFRLQTFIAAGAIGLALFAFIFSKLSLRWLVLAVTLLSVRAVWLALQTFFLATEAIAATYASPISLGWGGWLTIAGAAGLVVSAAWIWVMPNLIKPTPTREPRRDETKKAHEA